MKDLIDMTKDIFILIVICFIGTFILVESSKVALADSYVIDDKIIDEIINLF